MDIVLDKRIASLHPLEPRGALFMDFKISTPIHCLYKAWKSKDIFYITPIVFFWKKNVIYI